jgi:hypothetical protein
MLSSSSKVAGGMLIGQLKPQHVHHDLGLVDVGHAQFVGAVAFHAQPAALLLRVPLLAAGPLRGLGVEAQHAPTGGVAPA